MTIISLFSGALGLDIGIASGLREQAALGGFNDLDALPELSVTVEIDSHARATIAHNTSTSKVAIFDDVTTLRGEDIIGVTGIPRGEYFLIAGGPPCQSFSTAGKRESVGDPRGSLFMDFVRLIEELRPRFFVMENVRGLLSAAIKHRPIALRGRDSVPLEPEEIQGSAFKIVLDEFNKLGYTFKYSLMNAADYGVPQKRHRLIIIGSRDHENIFIPSPTHAKKSTKGLLPWVTTRQAWHDLQDDKPEFSAYPESRAKYLRLVPAGGNWRDLPNELQQEAMGGAFHSGGGKVGFYRRLGWDDPAPTVTTSPAQKATDMCHPSEIRPITVREAARLQQFPDSWVFCGKTMDKYRQIGNAVPIGLGRAVGQALMETVQGVDKSFLDVKQEQPLLLV